MLQTLLFGRGFVLGIELFSLPDLPGVPLLACGGDDARVNLFVRQEGKVHVHMSASDCRISKLNGVSLIIQFIRVMSLLGHEDWIRDLHCIQEGEEIINFSCAIMT